MKKTIILLILILFLCGCQAEYNIKFNDSEINEEIKIYEDNSILEEYDDEEEELFNDEINYWELDLDYYTKEKYKENNTTGYKYNSYFTYDEFKTLTALNRCYEKFEFQKEPTVKIQTSNDFLCLNDYQEFDSFAITIETNYKVISSNADKKDGNKHTWIINKKNHKNKPIKIEIDKYDTTRKKGLDTKAILIIILFITLIIINFTVLKKDKKEKANY